MTRWTPTEREREIIALKRKVNAELAEAKAEEQRRQAKAEAAELYREFITDGGLQESLDLAERLQKSREPRGFESTTCVSSSHNLEITTGA